MLVPGLTHRVRGQIYDHVFTNQDHEVGGVLVGKLGEGQLPVVTGSIAAREADGQRTSVTFTHDAWATIHTRLEHKFPGQEIVGWCHSHPGFGIFLSRYDRFIHDNFFSDKRQIAYVVDPYSGTEGVFHWRNGELVLLAEEASARPGLGVRRSHLAAGGWTARLARMRTARSVAAASVVTALIALALFLSFSGGAARTPAAVPARATGEAAHDARTHNPNRTGRDDRRKGPQSVAKGRGG